MAALSVRGVHKRFGSVVALSNVDFDVDAGEVVRLVQPVRRVEVAGVHHDVGNARVATADQLQQIKTAALAFIEFIRNTPFIVQLFFFFFALPFPLIVLGGRDFGTGIAIAACVGYHYDVAGP